MSQETSTNVATKSSFINNFSLFNKSIWLNLLAWFTLQFSFAGIFDVLLNLYLARLGYDIKFIGQVNSAGAFGFALLAIPAGFFGARWGYRKMVILGLVGGVVFPSLLALSQFIGAPLQSAVIMGSYGLYSISMTLIAVNGITFLASASTDENRVHVFSVYATVAPLAGFFGSLVAGFLPGWIAGMTNTLVQQAALPYSIPLWVVPLLFAIFLSLFIFQTKAGNPQAPAANGPDQAAAGPVAKEKAPVSLFASMFILTILRISSFYALFVFFNSYLDSALKISTQWIGIITAISRLLPVPIALLTPLLVGRLGKFNLMIWISLVSAIVILPIGLSTDVILAALSFILVSGANAMASAAFSPLHQEATPEKWRSLMAGSVFSAEAVSFGIVAFAGGYIINSLGFQSFFMVFAGVTLLSPFLFWLLLKNKVSQA